VKELRGRVAVVTGGASGIGRAIAGGLAREGMRVVVADLGGPRLDEVVSTLRARGADALGVATDVSRFESVALLERRATEAFGPVHLLCNNAGVGAFEDAPLWELPLEDWRWTLEVNLWGVIHGLKAFLPGMLAHGEEGRVVNTSSGNGGLVLLPSTPIYSTSKSAVSALTEVLHHQLTARQAKIRASVLYPGPHMVASGIFQAYRNRPERFAREQPQGTPPSLEDIRKMAAQAGTPLETTTPEAVAEHFLAGLRAGAYFIHPANARSDANLRARTEAVLARRDPTPAGF
jgi:NAD(P)-dependent dehydrogenase (short-subunit alcohol dehydrogenase family)